MSRCKARPSRRPARDQPGPLHRVAVDDWNINACPHHGPALATGAMGLVHAAWYTQGRLRHGVFYARSVDGGRSFGEPIRLGREDERVGRPAVAAAGNDAWLAFKAFDGQRTVLYVQRSRDAGATWSTPEAVGSTAGYSDHPLFSWRASQVWLTWLTHDEGLHVLQLGGAR